MCYGVTLLLGKYMRKETKHIVLFNTYVIIVQIKL